MNFLSSPFSTKQLGCRKWGRNEWGFKGCLAALPGNRPKSAKIALFLPFSPFSGGCEEHLENPENGGKSPFFLRYPQICLNPHLLNPHLRHSKTNLKNPQKIFGSNILKNSGTFHSAPFSELTDAPGEHPYPGTSRPKSPDMPAISLPKATQKGALHKAFCAGHPRASVRDVPMSGSLMSQEHPAQRVYSLGAPAEARR